METSRNVELRILIVDARADDRALLCQQLLGLSERTSVFQEACSGEEAAGSRDQLSCVLLDCSLPGGGGVGWVRRLQESASLVPIIA